MSNTNILKAKMACQKVGKGLSTFWAAQNQSSPYYDSTFPKKIKLGARSVGWLENELDAWIERQAAKRNQATQLFVAKVDEKKPAVLPKADGVHQMIANKGEPHV